MSITNNLTITGPGAAQIAVSGNDASRVFDLAAGVTAEIDGLTITHGMATQGGAIQNAGTLTMSDDVVSYSLATDTGVLAGGGILNLAGGTLVLTNSTLSDNVTALVSTSLGLGGGLDNEGTATLTACTVSGNQADAWRRHPEPGHAQRDRQHVHREPRRRGVRSKRWRRFGESRWGDGQLPPMHVYRQRGRWPV